MNDQEFDELVNRVETSDPNDAEQTYRNAISSGKLTSHQERELTRSFEETDVYRTGSTGDHDND